MEFIPALRSKFDSHKPSLFELISEAQLSSLLPPTLRYLLTIATHRHPRYLLRILNSFDELYALLMVIIEYHHIKIYGGGFTENFYGLKREKVPTVGEIPRTRITASSHVREALALKSFDIWKSVAVMVGLPYLKRKLDESYEINNQRALLGAHFIRLPANPTLGQRFTHYYRSFLRKVYPSLNATYYFSILLFNISYLYDNSNYHSPFLWLIRTRMRRLSDSDYQAISVTKSTNKETKNRLNRDWVLDCFKALLPTSIFALKFLEWWHASDFSRQLSKKAAESIDLSPPVIEDPPCTTREVVLSNEKVQDTETKEKLKDEQPMSSDRPIASKSLLPIFTMPLSKDRGSCPICQEDITTATVCQTGFVFCYTCIHRWLEGNHDKQIEFMKGKQGKWESGKGRCAVSGRRVLGGTESLRRLMI
ncbi:Peroxisome assembly protein 12 [Erysiphe necator]|uniref:Peroxisome assembly protein 12 n=1 Tax=Uncinula necator TaxID=52586 RepID=A0A0B1PC36_UNCNE|nr:Peroxisome assembly protein 12 [Erysiphe necator]KHJ36247.1 putative peroxisome assembly protein 12 [Erysiphe necator]